MMGQIVLLPIYENFEAIRANGFFPVIINYSSVDRCYHLLLVVILNHIDGGIEHQLWPVVI